MDKFVKQMEKDIQKLNDFLFGGDLTPEALAEGFADMRLMSQRHGMDMRKCERLFPMFFLTDDMKDDFIPIARDFLLHEGADLSGLRDDTWFMDDVNISAQDGWIVTILGAAYRSAKNGSTYSRELLKYLFRTYYPDLYKSFKRFREIGMKDLFALAGVSLDPDRHKTMEALTAYMTILCLAPFFGITLKEECKYLLSPFEREYDHLEQKLDTETKPLTEEEKDRLYDELLELLPEDHMEQANDTTIPFVLAVLDYCGFDELVFKHARGRASMLETFAVLRRTFPKEKFTAREIYLYSCIFMLTELYGDSQDDFSTIFKAVLGLGDDWYEPGSGLFNPEKISIPSEKPAKTEPLKETIFSQPAAAVSKDELSEQVRELEGKLAKATNDNRHLRDRLKHAESQSIGYEKMEAELAACKKELAALRSHLYNMARYEEPAKDSVDENRMAEEISRLHVTIVGGHPNWTSKLKNRFPKWNFVTPHVSAGNDTSWVAGSDYVFFFTDTLSHAVYGTFIAAVRELRIPFGYIHGVNISANIRQIWEETREQ